MSAPTLIVRGRRVLLASGLQPATLFIHDDKLGSIAPYDARVPEDVKLIDAGDLLVTPGIVDSHVHINEPGRTEWEGFFTATQAAAAGGITTVVDMPLNCIPATVTREAAEEKQRVLRDQLHVDVVFWGGVIPGNAGALEGLAEFGVPGAKCFLCPSGVDEFPNVTRADLELAMPVLRDLGRTLLVHAELPGPLERAEREVQGLDPTAYDTFLRSRPRAAEDEAIAMIIELSRKHRCPAHIVHLSSGTALPMIRAARADGVPITAETCLHYLAFTAEEIEHGATQFKCAPPIREAANRELLWQGLADGTISMVVSDHSPCTPQLKKPESGDFMGAWGGISSLQLGLSVLFTLARQRGYSLAQVFEWNAAGPARLAGLSQRKGRLAKGFDADLVIWNDTRVSAVRASELHHRHKITPYAGRGLLGEIEQTYVGGRLAFDRANGHSPTRAGRFVKVG